MPPRFTLRQLDIFAAVVRTGQVKRAADTLHLSPAAVSQALTELAEALGITLFERRGRAIVPTIAAREVLAHTAAPMAELATLYDRLAAAGGGEHPLAGEVRLAASSTIARYILPEALCALHRAHPALRIDMRSGNSRDVEARVADLEADIGFIEGPATRDDVVAGAWHTDRLQIIAPTDYPVANIRADTLTEHAWIEREPGSGTRAVFEQSLALAGFPAPRATLTIEDTGAIVRAVAAGAGLACVSHHAARRAIGPGGVRIVSLPALELKRPLWRLTRSSGVPSPMLERVIAEIEGTLAGLEPAFSDH